MMNTIGIARFLLLIQKEQKASNEVTKGRSMKRSISPVLFGVLVLGLMVWATEMVEQAYGDTIFLPVVGGLETPDPPIPTHTATMTQPTNTPSPTATQTPAATPAPHFPLAYGPYRTGQSPTGTPPSPAELAEDLDILKTETNLLRTYGSCDELEQIPLLARAQLVYLYQGIALSSNDTENQRELACYAQLVQENENIIAGIAGNEVLLRGDLTEAQLVEFILQAQQLGNPPVSTGDTWGKWCNLQPIHPRCPGLSLLRGVVDFVLIHAHPYWEAVPIEHAAAHVVAVQIYVRTTYSEKEVVVGETGWPTCGEANGLAEPGLANQRRFVEELWRWAKLYGIKIFYFEAFDELWKQEPKGVGTCWGLFEANRTPKHPTLDWSTPRPFPTATTPAVSIDWPGGGITTTVKSNCGLPVLGRVHQAQAGWQVQMEVFTNDWYIQDKWYANGRAPVVNGQWAVPEVILAGRDAFNNHRIRATLLNEAGNVITSAEVAGIVRANDCTP
jgi:exo-beta-1,3-glucanase (GH17 family)